jgi:hypothetical protein
MNGIEAQQRQKDQVNGNEETRNKVEGTQGSDLDPRQ